MVLSLVSLATIHMYSRNDTTKALQLLNDANEQILRLPYSPFLHGYINDNFCKVHLRRGGYTEALKFAEIALSIYQKQEQTSMTVLVKTLTQHGDVLYRLNRFQEAAAMLLDAYSMRDKVYNEMPKRSLLHNTLVLLIRVYQALKQPTEAIKYYDEACRKKKELYDIFQAENKSRLSRSTMAELVSFQEEFASSFIH